ncbi:protease Do-like 10, mitochondrial [Malania oleifera]|uniref:protease Do-like 10, mitochondrial n=1 Tax=Malania oleifera TaxID=397392 RepID=UPI0025AE5678|nr:protease Do-like 10, mitochondrial [Malania oleifera]
MEVWDGWCARPVNGPHGVGLWKNISQGWASFSCDVLYDIGNGSKVKFWQDHWCGETSLAVSYPDLYRFCRDKEASMAELMKFDNGVLFWDVSFLRGMHLRELEALTGFMDTIYGASVKGFSEDKMCWKSDREKGFLIKGFVIFGRRILTNAHVVADHAFVLVRKHGSPTKYRAKVQAVGHECDLAILVVENDEFWDGMSFLELGSIPFLQEAVAVVGYPQGGDNISVTKGIVSRVELTQYVHGASQLMAIQIDAAINPGNSGGPAIMGNEVAGVAFQNLAGAENIGYIIPVPVIEHFIAGVEESGKYVGFCSLGLSCQPTENVHLRNHFQMCPEMTGVLVSKINVLSDAHKILKKDDILLAFDDVPIANDGTVPFRNRERITFDHLVSMKKPNERAKIRVLRDGKVFEFSMILRPLQPLVPVHQFDKLPSYFIFAGLVFVPLTQPYLHEYGDDWYNTSPRRLCERALRELPRKSGEQLVILSQVLMDEINAGYERLAELQVKKVNEVEIDNLKHLCRLVENCSEESLRFDLDDERVIVLNTCLAKEATPRILTRHRISSAMSVDLIDEQGPTEIELACLS